MSHANMDAMVSLCKFSLLKFMIPHIDRIPDSILKDKAVAELGCGNGWITIAVAEKCCL